MIQGTILYFVRGERSLKSALPIAEIIPFICILSQTVYGKRGVHTNNNKLILKI